MEPKELLAKAQEFIKNKDFDGAKAFIEEHKNELGEYFDKAKALLEGNDLVNGALDKVKGLFGK